MASTRGRRTSPEVPDDAPAPAPTTQSVGNPDRRRPIVGAAHRVKLTRGASQARMAVARQEWQKYAWQYFDDVPEIKNGLWLLGNLMSKLRLFVAVHPDGDTSKDPIPVTDEASGIDKATADRAEAELARLRSSLGGRAEILRAMNMNLEVAGDAWIVGRGARVGTPDPTDPSKVVGARPESWEVRSILEVVDRGGEIYVLRGEIDTQGEKLNLPDERKPDDPEADDTLIRIYQRHPGWASRADCAMRGLLLDCEAVLTLTNEVLAQSRSRHSAGVFTVPNELTLQRKEPGHDDSGDEAGADNTLVDDITQALVEPVDDPGTAAAAAPWVLTGPGEYLKPDYVRHIELGNKRADDLEAKISGRVERIARGMNMPPELAMGHQQTTFANAAQVSKDSFTDYLEPRAMLIADGLTVGFLVPNLSEPTVGPDGAVVDAPVDPETLAKMFVWFDPGDIIGDPDRSSTAIAAHGAGLISAPAARDALGYADDDAPDPTDLVGLAGFARGQVSDIMLAAIFSKVFGVDLGLDAAQLTPAAPPAGMAASARRVPALGRRLTALDRDLRARLLVLAGARMDRTLERAGAKLRNRGNLRSLATDVSDQRAVAAHLGRSVVTAAGFTDADLIGDAFADLHDQFVAWATQTGDDALDMISQAVGGLSDAERATVGVARVDSIEQGWAWFEDAMVRLAEARMYDPFPSVADVGEIAGDIPAGLVRAALARAAGVTGIVTDGASAYVAVPDGVGVLPGMATSPDLFALFGAHGGSVEGYVWDYGPGGRTRPFQPHQELDGVTFQNFDDPVLAVTGSFPETGFYIPGDHGGCLCDVSPVMISPAEREG